MLLCAGFGTRLGTLSDERPKPMLPVCDLPILRYGIALLRKYGIRDIVINLHHRGDIIERDLGTGEDLGVRVRYIREPTLLGTGGGLKNALPLLDPDGDDEPFLSLNGKLILDLDIPALLAAYRTARDGLGEWPLGMMVVRRVDDALDWGAVDVDASGAVPRVTNILGAGQYMFCGVHVTRPSVVRRLPEGEACMVRQGYLPWLQGGEMVAAYPTDPARYFAEHSTPERYLQSNVDILRTVARDGQWHTPGPRTGIAASAEVAESADIRSPVYIGPGAIIGPDATIGPDAIIGAGARVAAGVRVAQAVVWPGACVDADAHSCIVTERASLTVKSTN